MYYHDQEPESVATYLKCGLVMVILGACWVAPAPPHSRSQPCAGYYVIRRGPSAGAGSALDAVSPTVASGAFFSPPAPGILSFLHLTCGYPLVDTPISRGLAGDGSLAAMLGERKSNYASNPANHACCVSQSPGNSLFFSQIRLKVFGCCPARMARTRAGDSKVSRSSSLTVV
jgi:hypothetical protein